MKKWKIFLTPHVQKEEQWLLEQSRRGEHLIEKNDIKKERADG